jgi:hypothetical protein
VNVRRLPAPGNGGRLTLAFIAGAAITALAFSL